MGRLVDPQAGLLLRLSHGAGAARVSGYSHRQLAEMIGTHRETVTQTLGEFKARVLVRIGRKWIELLRPDALEAIRDKKPPHPTGP